MSKDPRYTVSDKAVTSRNLGDAIKHSQGTGRTRYQSTDINYDKEAKRKFDENYDAIFRKDKKRAK